MVLPTTIAVTIGQPTAHKMMAPSYISWPGRWERSTAANTTTAIKQPMMYRLNHFTSKCLPAMGISDAALLVGSSSRQSRARNRFAGDLVNSGSAHAIENAKGMKWRAKVTQGPCTLLEFAAIYCPIVPKRAEILTTFSKG
jgi:hypothetical protein